MNTRFDQILLQVREHIPLSEEEEKRFISLIKAAVIPNKSTILGSGEVCRHEYFVNKGCLRAYYLDDNGFEHTVQFALEGWWISDLFSLITGEPAWLIIDALEESEVFQLERNDLEDLYLSVPKFERFFRIKMRNAFVAQQRRIVDSMRSAEARYISFVTKYPSIEQRVHQKIVATYLGITPEFLSTLRKRLSKKIDF